MEFYKALFWSAIAYMLYWNGKIIYTLFFQNYGSKKAEPKVKGTAKAPKITKSPTNLVENSVLQETRTALKNLGFKPAKVNLVIEQIEQDESIKTVEQAVRKALDILSN